ncbi:Histone-lysine N-methyltransferase SMYD1 [Dryobates pubescens]|uniref:[histone H3]-lysine(4) N-trimethyltransferase n=1 Tax=Dryobates pubescens TaxID=118200 RepID=A0A093G5D9_DRYPU|nr:Histone-lysine N-methyltransferase SMYD1 [Dryobates pubescens]
MTKGGMESVELFTSEGKGRGLKAQKEFLPGDVIFAEPAYAAVVFDRTSTWATTTPWGATDLGRCGWKAAIQRGTWGCWLAVADQEPAVPRGAREPMASWLGLEREGSGLAEGCLVSIDDLQNHVESFSEEEKKELRVDVESFLEFWPPQSQQFGIQFISHIFGVISCNGFTLSDQRGLQAVGVGIFPNLCQANHDCWPNCTVIFNNGNHEAVRSMFHTQMRIELRALSKISAGEELSVSYVDFLSLSEERRRQLRKQYYFDCTCEHCQKRIKDDLMLAVKAGESKPSAEAVKEVVQLSKDTLEKINKARMEGLYHEVVKLCRECLKKQEAVLGDTNIYLLRILSIASEVLSYLQMFEEAADYAKRMVDGYLKLYHPNNAQLGMAVMRAGVTHWHAGLIEAGHGLICKAYAILLITHGPSHPITKDLEVMRVQTEMELRMFQQNEFMYYKMREAALKNQKIHVMPEPSNETSPSLFHKKE